MEGIEDVKLVILDVDGVLTDGRIVVNSEGHDLRFFNVADGTGIAMLHRLGYKTAIISGKETGAVTMRAADLSIGHVHQGISDKVGVFENLLKKLSLEPFQACYIGDDIQDVAVMKRVGFPVAVANARLEVKEVAHYTTKAPGGKGAVREVCELVIKSHDRWTEVCEHYGLEERTG